MTFGFLREEFRDLCIQQSRFQEGRLLFLGRGNLIFARDTSRPPNL